MIFYYCKIQIILYQIKLQYINKIEDNKLFHIIGRNLKYGFNEND